MPATHAPRTRAATPVHAAPPVFTRAAIRRVDRRAASRYHLAGPVLMENAGAALARAAIRHLAPGGRVLILCGPGNNGGDGLVAARHLAIAGIPLTIILTAAAKAFSPDAETNHHAARAMRLPIVSATTSPGLASTLRAIAALRPTDLVIDALLGTGLNRPVAADSIPARLITALNACRAVGPARTRPFILAVDIPSGLDADTGKPRVEPARATAPPTAVIADLTLTLVGPKRGMLLPPAKPFVGTIEHDPVGIPLEPSRSPRSHRSR
jgi:hydroxyethylthiazole kinase-like uncharacterized protein yjeF